MKAVKNKSIGKRIPEHYYCKHCGAEDSGSVRYSETVRGSAILVNFDGDLDDYETYDTDYFEVDSYVCDVCNMDAGCLEDMFTDERPDLEEDDE